MLVHVKCHVPIDLHDVFNHLFQVLRLFDKKELRSSVYADGMSNLCDIFCFHTDKKESDKYLHNALDESAYKTNGYYAWHWDDSHRAFDPNSFWWQVSQMAIYFVNEKTFDEESAKHQADVDEKPRDRDKDEIRKEERSSWTDDLDAKPDTEKLGYYMRASGLFDQPAIVICMDRIWKITGDQQDAVALTIKVLIHEFAHALMDVGKENKAYGKYDAFHHWLEESLANYLTLAVLKNDQDSQLYDYAKNFIAGQSPAYRLGGILHDQGLPLDAYSRWRDRKQFLGTRASDSVKEHKNAWLDEVRAGRVDVAWLYDNLLS